MFVCWKRYSTKTIVILILKYLAQPTNTYSKSATGTLKSNSRDCTSLLTTCSMSKTFLKCFLVYHEHVFVYCHVFAVTISFFGFLLSILNRFHTLIYFYLLSDSYWTQKKPPEVFFKKVFSTVTQYCTKASFLGSLFNEVVGLQACNYIKKRLEHRCFLQNLQKFANTIFCKTSANDCFSKSLARWVKVKKITERSSRWFRKVVVKARSSHRWCSMKKSFS